METCPQCNADQIEGNAFCNKCGHKFTDAPQFDSDPNTEIESKETTGMESKETTGMESKETTGMESKETTGMESKETTGMESKENSDQTINSNTSGAIYILGASDELKFTFDDRPKIVGRNLMREFLSSQNMDPGPISAEHCTIFKEDATYWIEDGVTSIQKKPSTNGTEVNDNKITDQGKTKLNNGDKIIFAGTVNAVFRIG